jgi:hypothetical protein
MAALAGAAGGASSPLGARAASSPGGGGASSPLDTRAASFADRGASVLNLGVVECLWVGVKRKLK